MPPEITPQQQPCRFWYGAWGVVFCLFLAGCQTRMVIDTSPDGRETQVFSGTPTLVEYGMASWYGGRWIGRLTANGETYRAGDFTSAHKKLPFNTRVRVVDLKTGNSIVVRVNNRGPYVKGRIIDLSVAAAKKLGTYDRGIAKVRIEALREIPLLTKSNVRAINPPKPPGVKATPPTTPTGRKPEILRKN